MIHGIVGRLARARTERVVALAAFLGIVYLPTFLYPYLLTDETWIVRPNTATWAYRMGRPLFSVVSWPAVWMMAHHGMEVIYAMRAAAVAGLALSAYFLARWLETYGHERWTALGFAAAAMTLPAFQIVVADGTQLAFAILFAILATLAFRRGFAERSALFMAASGALLFGALMVYQQQALVMFALLAVPLLQRPGDRRTQVFVLAGGAFATLVSVVYFVAWRVSYRVLLPGRTDLRYGPDAVGVPTVADLSDLLHTRWPQVANLWHVEGVPVVSWIVVGVGVLILVKMVRDLRAARARAALSYAIVAGLLLASDSFRIVAHSYPSYVTGTALSLLLFYWAFCGAAVVLGRWMAPTACGVAVLGGVLAFVTVRDEIALPNWRHTEAIRSAILGHPDALDFHILGTASGGPGYQEFGWRNSATDVYLYLTALDVADDLSVRRRIPASRRSGMYISVAGMNVHASPESTPGAPLPDSIVVRLE